MAIAGTSASTWGNPVIPELGIAHVLAHIPDLFALATVMDCEQILQTTGEGSS